MMCSDLPHNKPHKIAECAFCKDFHEFELPATLIDELLSGNVVLFAGAGISTEDRKVFPFTFYEEICRELKVPEEETISFSNLMSRYCAQPNGRANLLRKIRDRLEYIRSFPELYRIATRFHSELSTFFFIQSIVTTNWDDYFERECGAIPFVTADDFTFWSIPGRKVFKIHGSISNLASLVATTEDYKKCYERLEKGILGSSLKMMLATKTILYMGYSFSDEDFIPIHSLLSKEMGQLMPHGYIVTFDRESEQRYRELGLTPIFTDATNFISVIKQHAIQYKHMLSDEVYDKVLRELAIVQKAHFQLWRKFEITNAPDIIFASSYQDGLIHAFERIITLKNSGYYTHTCNIYDVLRRYDELRNDKLKAKKYIDVAYINGYMNGLLFLVINEEEREFMPLYYVFGVKDQPRTFDKFADLRKRASEYHKSAHKFAMRLSREKGYKKGTQIHHTPFLS